MNVALLFLMNSALAAVPTGIDPNTILHEYDANGVERIQIDNVAGKITLRLTERPRVIANVTKKKFPEQCALTFEKPTPELVVFRATGPSFEECEADFDVQVPKKIDVTINAGVGPVNVSGTEGRLEFRVGTGNVNANGTFSDVQGRSGTGEIEINGINGGGSITSGSGRVTLKFNEDPKGDFNVSAGTGDATVLLPKGFRFRGELASGTGSVKNELMSIPKADFGLTLKSGTGDVTVKSY
ncbi:MAG: DUF4097 family beta strand repeat protein [Bdellovibrionales bacterium]|nr:DUF4097 family beta strand repeat protein [Bdellovibrionales bacterium]